MSGNMKPKKAAQSQTRDFQIHRDMIQRESEWGPIMVGAYRVGEHRFEQPEAPWHVTERITAMLVEAGVVDILAFNDLAGRTNAQGLLAALTKAGKTSAFLALVLKTADGATLAPEFFNAWPGWVVEPLAAAVVEDFFTTNPRALSGLLALSMPELALKTAAATLTGTSSTSPATATSPGSR